jgi:hypothetical protein
VSNARLILVALICALPVILLMDGPVAQGMVAGILAAGIAVMAHTMRPGETEFLISITWPIAAIAAIPALWMLIQILPLRPLAHPIWSSAESALGHRIEGSISIDMGASVMALGQYLLVVAVVLLSAAVAVDRKRAEWVLFSLTGASALIGLVLTMHDLFGLTFLSAGAAPSARAQAIDCTALGVIISAAAGIRTLERYETRRASPERSVRVLTLTLAACSAALAICAATLTFGATGGEIIATGYGFGALASVMVIRRLGLGPWGTAAIVVPALGMAIILAAKEPNLQTRSFAVAFAVRSPAPLTALSQRMLNDAPAVGTGAGTYAAMMPIYRDIDDPVTDLAAPTTMSALTMEMGRPMLWLVVAATVSSILILLRASFRRGRDSFYPAAGASCLITLLLLSFMNAGLLGTAVAIITSAIFGLAIVQSKSRTT